jgi:hypothetical protein
VDVQSAPRPRRGRRARGGRRSRRWTCRPHRRTKAMRGEASGGPEVRPRGQRRWTEVREKATRPRRAPRPAFGPKSATTRPRGPRSWTEVRARSPRRRAREGNEDGPESAKRRRARDAFRTEVRRGGQRREPRHARDGRRSQRWSRSPSCAESYPREGHLRGQRWACSPRRGNGEGAVLAPAVDVQSAPPSRGARNGRRGKRWDRPMKKKKFLAKGLSSGCREGGKRVAFPSPLKEESSSTFKPAGMTETAVLKLQCGGEWPSGPLPPVCGGMAMRASSSCLRTEINAR